ncbi:TPR-like protein [Tuber magnatum]|uniref:TPR-like protein n=1 Tax=Tuber magnatum TaxID=42249 RepID=A0A317T2D4_9PEZI|nr:TPR-like protein [Tuber magnatum]
MEAIISISNNLATVRHGGAQLSEMASQRAGGDCKVMDRISQVQSDVDGNFNGNTGNHNVFGNGNMIWSMQMPRDTTNLGETNEGQAMRARDGGESREASRPYWMVPYCRNIAFTGRESVIKSLEEVCKSGAHNRVALHGLGGCGKTQIALEYVYQRSGEGHFIDNADNDADFIGNTSPISKFVPQGRKGTVIFTTRSRQVAIRQGCKIIKVGKMEPEEALELFSKRFDSWHSLEDEEKEAVTMILSSVDHLPLAVVGSSAFTTENGTSPSVYWSILQENDKRARELLSERSRDVQREVDMTESILGTYFITFDRMAEQMPLAANLLGLIAFFDRQNIPEELLTRSGLEGMDDSLKFCLAIGKLVRFSLVTEVKHEGTTFYELHRLVQLSIQTYLSIEVAKQGRAAGLQAISRLFPEYEYERQNICAAYMSHAPVLTKYSTDTIAEDIVYRMAMHYMEMGSYNDAEVQIRQCIALREADNERDREGDKYSRLILLGMVHFCQGRAKEAEMVFLKVLRDIEKDSGLDHPNILALVRSLTHVLREQGRYEKLEEVVDSGALDGCEKSLGLDHPDTLIVTNILALALLEQGRYEESEVVNRRALEECEKSLGSDHQETLWAVSSLAWVLREQGRYEESEVMNRRVLEGCEKSSGPDHPETLMAANTLAVVLWEQARYEESEVMNRRVLEGYEKSLGSDHSYTLMAINNLAQVLRVQGRYEESEVMNRRALEEYEKRFGSDHPNTLAAINNLGVVLLQQGRYGESELISRRALEGYEESFGSDYPKTWMPINNLALVLRKQGKYEEAEVMSRRALERCEKCFGSDHPNTLTAIHNRTVVLREQGRYEASEVMNRRALEGYEKSLGSDHPDTLIAVNDLALVLRK